MNTETLEYLQKKLCEKYGADFHPSPKGLKVGIAENVKEGFSPINGLRHPPEGNTTGWYIYTGEAFSDDPEFFKPLHVEHLNDWCPQIKIYLGLPPGWRFLVAEGYEDVWFDKSLLAI